MKVVTLVQGTRAKDYNPEVFYYDAWQERRHAISRAERGSEVRRNIGRWVSKPNYLFSYDVYAVVPDNVYLYSGQNEWGEVAP